MRPAKIIAAALAVLLVSNAVAQEARLEPTQNPDAPYRLFATKNIYTFLKLDTRAGYVWQLQWGDKDHRITIPINLKPLVPDGKPGRFTLYPSTNIFTFVLLDQETGDTWQVQWNTNGDRFLEPIP